MKFLKLQPLFPERKGFVLDRPSIGNTSIFCHFLTPVTAYFNKIETKLQPGACVFWDFNAHQHYVCHDCDMLHNWFHADETIHPLMEKYKLEYETVYYPQDNDALTRIFQNINAELTHKAPYYREAVNALTESLFIELARSDKTERVNLPINSEQKEMFLDARSQIHMEIQKNWTVEKMAKLVNISPSRFYNLYKKFFGISPQKDLIQRRIQAAQVMLERGDVPIAKVAELTGYTNQYHFIRQFKQITGKTPGQMKSKE